MKRTRNIFLLLPLSLLLLFSGCSKPGSPVESPASRFEKKISAFVPGPDVSPEEMYQHFQNAQEALLAEGIAAFPALLAHFDDPRPANPPVEAIDTTVGDACYYVVMNQLLPQEDWLVPYACHKSSEQRRGADGALHERNFYRQYASSKCKAELKHWIESQKKSSLHELQVSFIRFLIEKENEIGYLSPEDKTTYLAPLIANLKILSAQK